MNPILMIILPFLLLSCSVFGIRSEEEPSYEVLLKENNIEIRQYKEIIVARTVVAGDYKDTTSQGFRRLANYIFGENKSKTKIAMTAPVIQEEKSKTIEMTAPVFQEKKGSAWVMTFTMPSHYSLKTLPEPLDPEVEIAVIPGKTVATIQYAGRLSENNINEHTKVLLQWLDTNKHKAISSARSAGYNPPWTIPFFRRNEVHIDIAQEGRKSP